MTWIALAVACAFGCSRTGLDALSSSGDDDYLSPPSNQPTPAGDGGSRAVLPVVDAGPDARVADAAATDGATPVVPPVKPTKPTKPGCTPTDETCNGVDDDCDGKVDDDLPSIPCAGGGEQYCVAGRYSACPTRCEACVPGSERVCFLSYCTYWAVQSCAADGKSFGVCRERHVPKECEAVSEKNKDSAELEQCCLDKGYCCRDEYDLDHDGNDAEMLGSCDEVSCSQ